MPDYLNFWVTFQLSFMEQGRWSMGPLRKGYVVEQRIGPRGAVYLTARCLLDSGRTGLVEFSSRNVRAVYAWAGPNGPDLGARSKSRNKGLRR